MYFSRISISVDKHKVTKKDRLQSKLHEDSLTLTLSSASEVLFIVHRLFSRINLFIVSWLIIVF